MTGLPYYKDPPTTEVNYSNAAAPSIIRLILRS